MDFATSVKTCMTRKYAMFSTRASRSEFWFFQLFVLLMTFVASIIDDLILDSDLAPISLIVSIAIITPSIAVGARRLHDIGRSGWWQLLWLIPILGWIVLVLWWTTKSDVGDNRFGPSPVDTATNPATTG